MCHAFGPLHNARRRAVIWRRKSPRGMRVYVYVDR
jgi:hypothetical protein